MAPHLTKKSKTIIVSSDDSDDKLNLVQNPDDPSSDLEEPEVEIVDAAALATPLATVKKWKCVDKEKEKDDCSVDMTITA